MSTSSPKRTLLIVDDDRAFCEDLSMMLQSSYKCLSVASAKEATSVLAENKIDILLLDIDLGHGMDGLTFLKQLRVEMPYLPVIMVTGDDNTATIVEAIKSGAHDYVGKQPDLQALFLTLERALRSSNLEQDIASLKSELHELRGDLIGSGPAMQQIKRELARLASANCSVLILGESGTGKELAARAIHENSERANEPFVALNCAAVSRDLFESELFGHEKGAFTGALTKKIGKFELARKGTLFLDEISEIEPRLQAKLLRVLQERTFERVGGNVSITCSARILASSNRDLQEQIDSGEFRADLYYRLNVAQLTMPPLRERRSDIPELARAFAARFGREMKKPPVDFTADALELLTTYSWPGNVRELQNCVENAIVHCDDSRLRPEHFARLVDHKPTATQDYKQAKKACLDQFHREYLGVLLKLTGGNVSQAAERAGLSRQGLIKILNSFEHEIP